MTHAHSLYGPLVLLAHLMGACLLVFRARKHGLKLSDSFDLVFFVVLAGALGARGGYMLSHWTEAEKTFGLFPPEKGGLSLFPALLACLLVFLFVCRWKKWSPWKMADLLAPALFLGLIVIRFGCLSAGCCYGISLNLSQWGWGGDSHTLPLPLLEILILAIVLTLVWPRTPLLQRSGLRTTVGFLVYGLWRLLSDPLRLERDSILPGHFDASSGLVFSAMLIGITLIVAAYLLKNPATETKP
jgi:prolipoprotein diacylglyceryltransferase